MSARQRSFIGVRRREADGGSLWRVGMLGHGTNNGVVGRVLEVSQVDFFT